jgi:hypothetical protein
MISLQKTCCLCGSTKTYVSKKTGREQWSGGKCANCYVRLREQKNIPKNVKCKRCQKDTTYVTKYNTPVWVEDKKEPGTYFCKSCSIAIHNTRRQLSAEQKRTISIAVRKAYEDNKIIGFKKIHTFDQIVFNKQTELRDYWLGFLITDGNIYFGKNGNPRLTLKLGVKDLKHLNKFKEFLKCSNPIEKKIEIARGKYFEEVYMRLSIPRKIAEKLASFGVTARKTLSAKVIGLENSRHFWRGVVDGDGHLKNRDGIDTDIIVLTSASYDLVAQFEGFIKCKIEGAEVTIKAEEDGRYSKVYRLRVYSNTARMLARLLYGDCHVALDRKLSQAQEMFGLCLRSRSYVAFLDMEKERCSLRGHTKYHRHLTQQR